MARQEHLTGFDSEEIKFHTPPDPLQQFSAAANQLNTIHA
jgi:hypothetical protein